MPVNTASNIYMLVRALRKEGVDAQGLVFNTTSMQTFDGLLTVRVGNKRKPWLAAWGLLEFVMKLRQYFREGRPDLIHWYYSGSLSTLGADVALLKVLNVPGIVEWVGSDIRIPEVEFAENSYYTEVFDKGYEYRPYESQKDSHRRQQRFADLGFTCLAGEGMLQYVQRDIFPNPIVLRRRVVMEDMPLRLPDPNKRRPLVVHSPTRQITKGTDAVLRAVESLKSELDFDFQLVSGVPHKEALQIMANADIFLDQFVLGDWGGAALEALAMGKPVVCYLKPSILQYYPPGLPLVNATKDTLREVLKELLVDGSRRRSLGEQGRAYAETYYDTRVVVQDLIAIYRSVIEQHRARGRT